MRDGPDIPRSIWRTPLAAVLVAWMLLAIGTLLGSARLIEVLPPEAALALLVAVAATAPALLAWGFWAMLREPMTGWLAPTVLLAFCGVLVPAAAPLLDTSVRLNFAAHRPTYDAIVANSRGLRPGSSVPGAVNWVLGERNGVRYRYRADRPGEIDFPWTAGDVLTEGVRYDDTPCVATPGRRCIDRGQRLDGYYRHYRLIF